MMTEKGFEIGGGWVPGRSFNEAVSAAGVMHHKDDYVLSTGGNGTGSHYKLPLLHKKSECV
jgi:hypothetical protein